MADTSTPAGAPAPVAPAPAFEPGTLYRVDLLRPVPVPGDPSSFMSPAHDVQLKGRVLNALAPEAFANAVAVR